MASDQATTTSKEKDWQKALRAFHLTGLDDLVESESPPDLTLWPALASKLEEDRLAAHYPLFLPSLTDISDETEPVSLLHVLENLPFGTDSESTGRSEDLERIVRQSETIIGESRLQGITKIVSAALQEIDSENEDEVIDPGLRDRLSRLNKSGRLVGFGQETLPLLYCWTRAAQRQELEARFHHEIEELIVGLEAMLFRRATEQDPDSLANTMGEKATAFVDLEKLSRNLPPVGRVEKDSEARLELIREMLAILQTYLDSKSRSVPFYLFSSGGVSQFPELPAESQVTTNDCFSAALEFVDGLLDRMSRVFRAVRVSRRLVSGRYQPEVHDEASARFQWQSCNQEEMMLVPGVVVVDSSAMVKTNGTLSSLSRLLRSGRPIHILITEDQSELAEEDLGGTLEDLGAIAMAHREAFVLQSTLTRPDHLLAGLREMVRTARPSIALVSTHPASQQGTAAWTSALLSHHGRVAPCFRYSVDRGPSWSDRLDISGNPHLESGRPVISLACAGLPAAAKKLHETVTFAHAAAVRPEFRRHFRVIPSHVWSDDQEPIGTYLEKFKSTPPASLPYIWIVKDGELGRAIITREMANACRDRLLAWKSLQELAGIDHKSTSKPDEETIRRELEARYQSETEHAQAQGREEGAVQAVNQIVMALLGQTTPGTAANLPKTEENGQLPPGLASPAPTNTLEAAQGTGNTQSTASQEAAPLGKPYIDSELCTTCNDCLKINPLLFVYNADNQAEIGDPLAGSYAQLVKAAEQCPARCIHPGAARADDKSATPAMIKRASKFS